MYTAQVAPEWNLSVPSIVYTRASPILSFIFLFSVIVCLFSIECTHHDGFCFSC